MEEYSDQELEDQADELLRKSGSITRLKGIRKNGDSGIYTEDQLHRRIRYREWTNCEVHIIPEVRASIECMDLILKDVNKLCKMIGFTGEECFIFSMKYLGATMVQLAEQLGVSRKTMHKRFNILRERFDIRAKKYPHYGWIEVYKSEVRRD